MNWFSGLAAGLGLVYVVSSIFVRKRMELPEFPPDQMPELLRILREQGDLAALKRIRHLTNWDLRRAKEFLERSLRSSNV